MMEGFGLVVKSEIEDVLKLVREVPKTREELILREFSDLKQALKELKKELE